VRATALELDIGPLNSPRSVLSLLTVLSLHERRVTSSDYTGEHQWLRADVSTNAPRWRWCLPMIVCQNYFPYSRKLQFRSASSGPTSTSRRFHCGRTLGLLTIACPTSMRQIVDFNKCALVLTPVRNGIDGILCLRRRWRV